MESGSRYVCINTVSFIPLKLNYRIIFPGEKLRCRQSKWLSQWNSKAAKGKNSSLTSQKFHPKSLTSGWIVRTTAKDSGYLQHTAPPTLLSFCKISWVKRKHRIWTFIYHSWAWPSRKNVANEKQSTWAPKPRIFIGINWRISKSKQDKSNIDCLAFKGHKKRNEFLLTGRKFYICQARARAEFHISHCSDPFWISTGRKRSAFTFVWCRLREVENERKAVVGTEISLIQELTSQLRLEARLCTQERIPFSFTSKGWLFSLWSRHCPFSEVPANTYHIVGLPIPWIN